MSRAAAWLLAVCVFLTNCLSMCLSVAHCIPRVAPWSLDSSPPSAKRQGGKVRDRFATPNFAAEKNAPWACDLGQLLVASGVRPQSSRLDRRAMLSLIALGAAGFASNVAFLPASRAEAPRPGVLRSATPATRMVPCICTGGRVGGRIGGRLGWLKPIDQSKERVKRFGRVQKALAVLIPAVVLATGCVSPIPSRGGQQVRLQQRDPQKGALAELGSLSSSVNYPGSRNDVATARRYYVEAPKWGPTAPKCLDSQLDTIRAKEEVHRSAQGGQWTYPGWRADAARGFKSKEHTDQRAMRNVAKTMDLAQELHKTVPQRMLASVWTSFRSMYIYAFRFVELLDIYAMTLAFWIILQALEDPFGVGLSKSNHLAWVQAWGFAFGGSVLLALSASSAIGFCPLIFLTGFYGLMAVLRDPP